MKKLLFYSLSLLLLFIACNNEVTFVKNEAPGKTSLSANRFYGVKYTENDLSTKGIAQRNKLWYPGSVITVKFLNGSNEYMETVRKYAVEWEIYAGITFEFITEGKADVRIGFDWNEDRYITWSYTGTDCKSVNDQSEATASFADWRRASQEEMRGDVLRLFGQVLGLELEYRHLNFDADWSERIADYWEGEIMDIPWGNLKEYVFDPLLSGRVIMTEEYDENSIMIWPFTRRYAGNTPRDFNFDLSEKDKLFIAQLYPKGEEEPVIVVEVNIDEVFPWVDVTLHSDNPFSVKVDYGDGNKKSINSTYYTDYHSLPVWEGYSSDDYSLKNIKIYANEGDIQKLYTSLYNVRHIDVSNCKTIEGLQLNNMGSGKPLDLSKNENLKYLGLSISGFSSILFPSSLEEFYSEHMCIASLDVSICTNLRTFSFMGCGLENMDFRNNLLLESVFISADNTKILFSDNSNLKKLGSGNMSVDLSCLPNLVSLENLDYQQDKIDLSKNIYLEELDLRFSKITSLDVSLQKNIQEIRLTGASIVDDEEAMIRFIGTLPDRTSFETGGYLWADPMTYNAQKIDSLCESKNWGVSHYPRSFNE